MVGRIAAPENRHPERPEVAELFKLCRILFERKHNRNAKDIEIGREVMGFDYKYTHQFRHGRANINNLRHVACIVNYFDIPVWVPVRILRRELDAEKAIQWIDTQARRPQAAVDIHGKGIDVSGHISAADGALVRKLEQALPAIMERAETLAKKQEALASHLASNGANRPADIALLVATDRPVTTASKRRKTNIWHQRK